MTASAADHRARVEARLAAVDRFVYRNRNVFAPLGLGVLLTVVGQGAHWVGWWGWVSAWILAGLWWAISWDITLDQPTAREKWYSVAVATTGAAWLSLVARFGLGVLLAIVGAVLLAGFGAPWAWHRRVRRGVEVDRSIEAWGDGTAVGLPGTHARGTKAGDGWYSFKIRANEPGRYTLTSFKQAKQRIAARFGVRAEAVSFADSHHEGEVTVTVRDKPREEQHATATTEPASIVGAAQVGSSDNGTPIEQALSLAGHGAGHSIAVGLTGSGKSGLINLGAARVAAAPDAILCLIDLSPGAQELKAWAPVCWKFATTVEETNDLFRWLNTVCQQRGRDATDRLFAPSEQTPQISVWMDEAATYFAPQLDPNTSAEDARAADKQATARTQLVEQGVRVYRKYGIDLHLATQYADVAAIGSATIRQQLSSGYDFVFRCAKNTDPHRLVPASADMAAGELPANKPGSCYVRGLTVEGTVQGRLRWFGDTAVTETVATWRGQQPTPEAPIANLPGGEPSRPPAGTNGGDSGESAGHDQSPAGDRTAGDTGTGGGDSAGPAAAGGTVPDFGAGESPRARQRLSPEQSRQLVLDTLRGFPGGATVGQVAETTGKGLTIVQSRLNELAATGLAKSKGRRKPVWFACSH